MRWAIFSFAAVMVFAGAASAAGGADKATLACVTKAEDSSVSALKCFGTVYADCMKGANADDAVCGTRELAFWQPELDRAWKDAKLALDGYAEMKPDQVAAQKAFSDYREKSCFIADKVDPGSIPGRAALCRAEITAQRALMLRRISYSLGEH